MGKYWQKYLKISDSTASGDAGGALGAALYLANNLNKIEYTSHFMNHLGPEFSDFEINFLREIILTIKSLIIFLWKLQNF